MELTKDQKAAFELHMRDKHGCTRCGGENMAIGGMIGLHPPNTLGGHTIPCVAIACGLCGQVDLISAKIAGVV